MITLKAPDAAAASGFTTVLNNKLADIETYGYASLVITDWIDMVEGWPKEVKDDMRKIITDVGVTVDLRGLSSSEKTDFRAKLRQIRDEWSTKALVGMTIDDATLNKLAAVIKK